MRSCVCVTTLCAAMLAMQMDAFAEEHDTAFRYGAYVLGAYDMHNAAFSKFSDVGYCCPTDFGNQNGFSAGLGGLLRFQPFDVLDKRLIFDVRLGASYSSATLTSAESTLFNDPADNSSVEATFDYNIATSWLAVNLDVAPTFKIMNGLAFHLGGRFSYLLSDDYNQTEKISQEFADQGFIFTDTQSPERNIASGSIPGFNSFQFSIITGLSWEFPLNKEGTVFIAPELFYSIGLTNPSSAVSHADKTPGSWSVSSLLGGVSIRFATGPTIKPDPCDTIINGQLQGKQCPPGQVLVFTAESGECFCKDTTTVIDSILVRIDAVYAIDSSAKTGGQESISVESFKVRQWRPTLPFVFFDQGSTNLDLIDQYRDISPETRMTFDVDPSFAKDYHKHLLNIIGKRLFELPNENISIVGYANVSKGETESIALDRAYAVRDYLYRRWSVGFERMKVSAGGQRELEKGSIPEEASAVQISATNPKVLAPIEMPATEVVVKPTHIQIQSTIQPGAGRDVASVEYEMRLGGGTGRRPKPLGQTFNKGDVGFDSAMKGWTADVGSPNSRIYDAVVKQLSEKDLIIIPSLSVTFSNGQKTEAEREAKKTTIPLVTLTPDDKRKTGRTDTAVLVFDVLFNGAFGESIDPAVEANLNAVLKDVPNGLKGSIEISPIDAASRAQDNGLVERRREAVKWFFKGHGIELLSTTTKKRDDPDPSTAVGSAYSRCIRVVVKAPIK